MSDAIRALNDSLTAIMSEMPRPAGKEDWQYRDLPKMRSDLFAELVALIGPDNIAWITKATYQHDGWTYERGQFWISPNGIERLSAEIKRKAS